MSSHIVIITCQSIYRNFTLLTEHFKFSSSSSKLYFLARFSLKKSTKHQLEINWQPKLWLKHQLGKKEKKGITSQGLKTTLCKVIKITYSSNIPWENDMPSFFLFFLEVTVFSFFFLINYTSVNSRSLKSIRSRKQ